MKPVYNGEYTDAEVRCDTKLSNCLITLRQQKNEHKMSVRQNVLITNIPLVLFVIDANQLNHFCRHEFVQSKN